MKKVNSIQTDLINHIIFYIKKFSCQNQKLTKKRTTRVRFLIIIISRIFRPTFRVVFFVFCSFSVLVFHTDKGKSFGRKGFACPRPVTGVDDFLHVFRCQFAHAHVDQRACDNAHHIVQKSVACDGNIHLDGGKCSALDCGQLCHGNINGKHGSNRGFYH